MKKHLMVALAFTAAAACAGCSGPKEKETAKPAAASEAAVETEASTALTGAEDAQETAGEKGSEMVSEAVSEAAEAMSEGAGDTVEAMSEAAEGAVESMSEAAQDAATEAQAKERPTYTALDYVTLGEYKDLPVEEAPVQEVTQEQIDARLAQEIKNAGKLETLEEGAVQKGDIANIDYEGKKDGVAFDGGTAKGYDLEIGSGSFIDGFEDGLIGKKIGETADLELSFPAQYFNEELAGAKVVFTVTVNAIQRAPQVTDELAGELSGGAQTSVSAYRDYLRGELEKEAQANRESQISEELMTQLYNTCKVNEYPQELVDYSIGEMEDYYKAYAKSMNLEWEDFLSQYMNTDADAFRTQAELTVKQGLQQELILMAVAEQENLTQITEEEFAAACEDYAQKLGFESGEAFQEAYDEGRIRNSVIMDKAVAFVREHALMVTAEEISEAATEAAEE